ncbi:hypothetical protein OG889_20315 [Streptomyces sp. NBC_00481]|uniref:hypothetical protein n=1 Tax=Streptomyces sp. NBC_00481 TaxID=2975755 RepID=UPI002DD7FB54|nr:hypothetical protein [Streptomyces sp. NBC_00481]WRZ01806.1 hypothetical protein OG889_20315 [Streptomyces sp. NBC_00481]
MTRPPVATGTCSCPSVACRSSRAPVAAWAARAGVLAGPPAGFFESDAPPAQPASRYTETDSSARADRAGPV